VLSTPIARPVLRQAPQSRQGSRRRSPSTGRARMLSYRVILDVPVELALYLTRLLQERRREIGTRRGTRALSRWRQAVFALAWFRDRPDIARLGRGFGISHATVYRYLNEAVEVLAARAPSPRQALEKSRELGLPYLIPDLWRTRARRRPARRSTQEAAAPRRLHLPRGPRNPDHRVHHPAQQASPAVQVELRRRCRARPLPRTPPPARTTGRPPRSRMTATLSRQDPVRNL
jgi:hypothetical protein